MALKVIECNDVFPYLKFYSIQESSITPYSLSLIKNNFCVNLYSNKTHPYIYENSINKHLKGKDKLHLTYLYYVAYLREYYKEKFSVFQDYFSCKLIEIFDYKNRDIDKILYDLRINFFGVIILK